MRNLLLALVLACATSTLTASQWPQWRGPSRDGIVPSVAVPAAWPKALTLKWRQPVGEGYSSPVVDGGRVFVHSRKDPEEIVTAFDLASGKTLWTDRYQSAFTKSKYATQMSKGPFSTPLVSNGRLYTLGSSAVLSSFDAATGELKWRKDWSNQVDTSKLFTGTAMSPLIDGGLLIVHVGDDTRGAFRALDPATGAERWLLPGHGPGYASPVVVTVDGTRQFVTMTDSAVVGVEIATGKELWQIPFPDEWHENIVTPVIAGDVLVVSGKQRGTFGYRVSKKGAAFAATELWHNAELPMYMSTPVADGSYIYGFGHRRKGQLYCLDARTGRAMWTTEGRGGDNAAIQRAGDNLLVLSTDATLMVVKRSPEAFQELQRYKVAESATWAHPVLLGREIVIRDADSLALWTLGG